MYKNLLIAVCFACSLLAFSSQADAAKSLNNRDLARYIASQIDGVLKDSPSQPYKICNNEDCVIVVQ